MNNPKKMLLAVAILLLGISNALAVVDFSTIKKERELTMVGFLDYPPFGYATYAKNADGLMVVDKRYNIFETILDDFARENTTIMTYRFNEDNYEDLIRKVRSGDIDILLGLYHETKLYEGLDYIVPALVSNPVVIITLPERSGEMKSLSEMKKMKGAILQEEFFSDYVEGELKKFNIERIKDPNEIFRKLFTKEIDFIFAGYYTGMIEASKLGLKNYISFSRQIIWDMPLFIGVSKASKHRSFLIGRLGKYSEQPEVQKKFKESLNNELKRYDELNSRTVPPLYTN